MLQATAALSLTFRVMICLPVRSHFFTISPYLMHGEFPLTREITRVPSMSAPRCVSADVLARYAKMTRPRT
jgi:hypothetical protein